MKEHEKTCTSKTRAERVVATVNQDIEKAEHEIAQTQATIARAQSQLPVLEEQLARAHKKKADAEIELGLKPAPAPAVSQEGARDGDVEGSLVVTWVAGCRAGWGDAEPPSGRGGREGAAVAAARLGRRCPGPDFGEQRRSASS